MITLKTAQEFLKGLGYDPGPIDGLTGPLTQKALSSFQGSEKLLVTGTLDEVTSNRLVQRAKEKGIGEGWPWWVWAGIVAGGSLCAWGIYKLVTTPSAANRARQLGHHLDAIPWESERVLPQLPSPRPLYRDPTDHPPTRATEMATASDLRNPAWPGTRAIAAPLPANSRKLTPEDRAYNALPHPAAITPPAAYAPMMDQIRREVAVEASPEPPQTVYEEAPSTVVDAPIPATRPEVALSGFGPKRASMAKLMEIDAEAQRLAYDRWSRAMKTLGEPVSITTDYANNGLALAERASMDNNPVGPHYEAVGEVIRTAVKKSSPQAQARFRKLVDINRKALMREKLGE